MWSTGLGLCRRSAIGEHEKERDGEDEGVKVGKKRFRLVWFEIPTRKPGHRRSGAEAGMSARATQRSRGQRSWPGPSWAGSTVILSRSGSVVGSGGRTQGAGCMRLG